VIAISGSVLECYVNAEQLCRMCTIQLWLCELTMVVCTKLFKMKHVRPKGRVYWTPKHVKQPHLRINRHMMFWEHNNAEQHFNNCQSALWCKHVQIGDKQNCTTVQSMASASLHTLEKLDQLCTSITATYHPCLVLHHFLQSI